MDLSALLTELDAAEKRLQESSSAPTVSDPLAQELQRFAESFDTTRRQAQRGEIEELPKPPSISRQGEEVLRSYSPVPPSLATTLKERKSEEIRFPNGDVYIGEVVAGHPHGSGELRFACGARYVGEFDLGEIHGQGIYYYTNGTRYEGRWRNGKRDGQGVIHFPATGARFEGRFDDGELLEGVWYAKEDAPPQWVSDPSSLVRHVPIGCAISSFSPALSADYDPILMQHLFQRLENLAVSQQTNAMLYLVKAALLRFEMLSNRRAVEELNARLLTGSFPRPPAERGIPKTLYRVLAADESYLSGLSAEDPLAHDEPPAAVVRNGKQSQFQVLSELPEWVLYRVSQDWHMTQRTPTVVEVEVARTVGRLLPCSDALYVLEGFIPAGAVKRVFSFKRATPQLRRMLDVRAEQRSFRAFESFREWQAALAIAFTEAETRALLNQAAHCHLFLTCKNIGA